MTDTLARPEGTERSSAVTASPASASESLAERLLDTQSPQRPQSTPRIRIEVDGRVVEGFEGQTILEVCRDNGIEIPTLCYEPKLPGFGACRMCVVEVEGEEHPPISCSRTCEPEMKVQTQTEEIRRLRRTNLELIFSDHNAYCLPPCQNKCPSHIDIPGFLKANAEGNFRESARIFKRTIPFPSVLGASARPRARSTAGATRWTRRSRSATRTATPVTRSSRRCSTTAWTRRSRSRRRSGPAGRPRSSAPGRPAWRPRTTC